MSGYEPISSRAFLKEFAPILERSAIHERNPNSKMDEWEIGVQRGMHDSLSVYAREPYTLLCDVPVYGGNFTILEVPLPENDVAGRSMLAVFNSSDAYISYYNTQEEEHMAFRISLGIPCSGRLAAGVSATPGSTKFIALPKNSLRMDWYGNIGGVDSGAPIVKFFILTVGNKSSGAYLPFFRSHYVAASGDGDYWRRPAAPPAFMRRAILSGA
jgi:hypothetical protein